MAFEGSLPCSKDPSSGPHLETDESNPHSTVFPKDPFYYYSPICSYILQVFPPSGFSTKILYTFLIPHMCTTCPAYLIHLDVIIIIFQDEYKLCSFSFCSSLQPPVTSSILVPNIPLSTLFSNSLNLCSSLKLRDQVSHSYRRTGKIIVWYILISMYVDNRREGKKILNCMVASIPKI
jgi:hypothetical protein